MTTSFTLTQTPTSANIWLYPSGTYHHSEVSVVGSASHYLNVDDPYDLPDDDTTYNWMVNSSTVTDMYYVENSTETGTINYVKIFARAKTNTYNIAPTGFYRILANHSGTTSRKSCTLTTDYNTFDYLLTSTPSGGAWNWTAVNALKIGFDANSPSLTGSTVNTTFRPNLDGSLTQSDIFGAATHIDCIKEVSSDGDTTYIYETVGWGSPSTGSNTFYLPNHTTETGTINYISLYAMCRCYELGAGTGYFQHIFKVGPSAIQVGSPHWSVTDDWELYSKTWTSNPTTGIAWTWGDIDKLEPGIFIDCQSGFDNWLRCTQLYVVVNYTATIYPQIRTTQMYVQVNYLPSAGDCYLSKPYSYTYTNNRQINKFNTWSGERKVYDVCRSSKTLTMTGIEYPRPDSVVTTALNCVRAMKDNGGYITISGIDDTLVDTDWLISDFNYSKNSENPNIYDWVLTMERYENV